MEYTKSKLKLLGVNALEPSDPLGKVKEEHLRIFGETFMAEAWGENTIKISLKKSTLRKYHLMHLVPNTKLNQKEGVIEVLTEKSDLETWLRAFKIDLRYDSQIESSKYFFRSKYKTPPYKMYIGKKGSFELSEKPNIEQKKTNEYNDLKRPISNIEGGSVGRHAKGHILEMGGNHG